MNIIIVIIIIIIIIILHLIIIIIMNIIITTSTDRFGRIVFEAILLEASQDALGMLHLDGPNEASQVILALIGAKAEMMGLGEMDSVCIDPGRIQHIGVFADDSRFVARGGGGVGGRAGAVAQGSEGLFFLAFC